MGAYKRGRYVEAAKRFRRSNELEPSKDTKAWISKSERAAKEPKSKQP